MNTSPLPMQCRVSRPSAARMALAGLMLLPLAAAAQSTNTLELAAPLPDTGLSLLRVLGALALVLAVFLGGVWLFRNWQRLVLKRGCAPRLNVIEARSLGGRHALYVVGYNQERFLLASSPAGVNLLSHLPAADEEIADEDAAVEPVAPRPSFAQALTRTLKGQ